MFLWRKGYYDLATPFFAAEYTFDHLGLDPSLRAILPAAYYEAGHMMYVHHAVAGQIESRHRAVYQNR